MKQNYLFRLFIVIACATLPGFLHAQISAIGVMPGHPNTPTIYPATGNTYANFPLGVSMDVLNVNGTSITKRLVVAFAKNPDNSPNVLTARITSMDGGVTWGNYQSLGNDAAMTIRRRNGTMVTFPFKQTGGPGTYNIAYHTSPIGDNGANWTNAITGTVNTNMNGHRSIIEEPNGDLYATCYQTDVKLIKSTDGGATWTWLPPAVFDGTMPNNAYSEPALERCADGSWLMVARLDGVGVGLRYSRSYDKGITWSPPAPLTNVPIQSGFAYDVDPHLQLMPNGVLVLSYGSRRAGTGDAWAVCTNRVAFSLNNGVTWISGTDTFVGARTSGVAPGGMTTGYTAVLPVSAHRFLMVSDNGSYQHYSASTNPNPFTIWGKFVDIVLPQQNRIDLKTKYSSGAISIVSPQTTLTYTDSDHPESRITGAFDGSTDYWSGALGTSNGVYELDLHRSYNINIIGLAMLYGKEQSATVQHSMDGNTWSPVVVSYIDKTHYALNYSTVTPFTARYIRVNVNGSGQVGLSEIELYESNTNTFENNASSVIGNPHGILPSGYVKNGTNATQYGFAVQDGLGYQSNKALRLWDASSNWRAGVKKIIGASNRKNLEFRCRISTIPANSQNGFNIEILGNVGGVEKAVFWISVAGSTATTAVVKVNDRTPSGTTGWAQLGTATLPISGTVWKLVKITTDEAQDTAALYIDGVKMGNFGMYADPAQSTNITGFAINSNGTDYSGESVYFDDINFYDPATAPQGIQTTGEKESLLPMKSDKSIDQKFSIFASPNPASGNVSIIVNNPSAGSLDLNFTDMSGRIIKRSNYNMKSGNIPLDIPIQNFAPGVYIVTATQKGNIAHAKLIVK